LTVLKHGLSGKPRIRIWDLFKNPAGSLPVSSRFTGLQKARIFDKTGVFLLFFEAFVIGLVQEPGWFLNKSSKKRRFLTKSAFFVVFMWLLFKN
jgi:hypothetical protein